MNKNENQAILDDDGNAVSIHPVGRDSHIAVIAISGHLLVNEIGLRQGSTCSTLHCTTPTCLCVDVHQECLMSTNEFMLA